MSKASEFAKALAARPTYKDHRGDPDRHGCIPLEVYARVDDGGDLIIAVGRLETEEIQVPQERARRLAEWILETF